MRRRIIGNATAGPRHADLCAGEAWIEEAYAAACDDRWTPDAIAMERDAAQWHAADALSEGERAVIRHFLGFLTSVEARERSALLAFYQRAEARACRQVLLHHLFEENLHASTGRRIAAVLGIDPDDALSCYRAAGGDAAACLMAPPDGMDGDQLLLYSLVVHACLVDGLLHAGFLAPVALLAQAGKMPGTAEQCSRILRARARHCDFGVGMALALRREKPALWDASFAEAVACRFRRTAELACAHLQACLPHGAAWIDVALFDRYLHHEANRRAQQIGLAVLFEEAGNPYAWMT